MKHASFLRTRRHKASVAAAFVMLIGVTLLCVLYQLKASRNLTLASEQSAKANPSMGTLVHEHSAEANHSMVKSLVEDQHTEPWRPQSHLDHSVEDLSGVDPVAMDTAHSYGLGRWGRVRHVVWPTALPYAMTGFRLAAAVALILAITAELIIGSPGLGREIAVAQTSGAVPAMYALVTSISE